MDEKSVLYIIATPIGNLQDITIRALDVLRNVDVVLCEERREGTTLMKKLDIPDKEILLVNEHNEKQMQEAVLMKLAAGNTIAMISDCGTPVFADPGAQIISIVSQAGFRVVPVPGPSSLMATLSVLDFQAEPFYYVGFLPREDAERARMLLRLKSLKVTLIIMETPYRLRRLIQDAQKTFGDQQRITLAFDLTLPGERIYRGSIKEVMSQISDKKGEFVLVVHPPNK
jgi:16S rRNA (cytidine1402-2'-O)-methyltransferase